MSKLTSVACLLCGVTLLTLGGSLSSAFAQQRSTSAPPEGFRQLAPHVLTVVPPSQSADDTTSTHDFVEALSLVPDANFTPYTVALSSTMQSRSTGTVFRRPVWSVEFSYKPVRFIYIDLPGEDGKLERKLVWYMVYRLRNPGGHFKPVQREDGKYEIERVDYPVRVSPQFALESPEYKKIYMDQIIPAAIGPIREREDPNRPLYNNVEISQMQIPVSQDEDSGVWGVATWTDIDLRIDFFSIFVKGLTNAYRWQDTPGEYAKGDAPGSGKTLTQKALQLNFWRPGDEFYPKESEIRVGIPGTVDYTWVYR